MSHEMMDWQIPTAVYLHIPFCRQKCLYCDFLSFAGCDSATMADYLAALEHEIQAAGSLPTAQVPLQTIYFGGGTPSLLPPEDLQRLLQALALSFKLTPDAEISLEANPGTLHPDDLKTLRQAGFTRISIGLQASQDHLLRRIGRIHNASDFSKTVRAARAAGFRSISADMMFGLPGQTLDDVADTTDFLLDHQVDHLSYYGLILEDGTPLAAAAARGELSDLPDDETERAQYHLIRRRLADAGLEPYEISSSARPGHRCRHHLVYWQGRSYYGFGLSAHSYLYGQRRANTERMTDYLAAFHHPAEQSSTGQNPFAASSLLETVDREEAMNEMMLLGLRLTDGVSFNDFAGRFGTPLTVRYGKVIGALVDRGLLVRDDQGVRLTCLGLDLANLVFEQFV